MRVSESRRIASSSGRRRMPQCPDARVGARGARGGRGLCRSRGGARMIGPAGGGGGGGGGAKPADWTQCMGQRLMNGRLLRTAVFQTAEFMHAQSWAAKAVGQRGRQGMANSPQFLPGTRRQAERDTQGCKERKRGASNPDVPEGKKGWPRMRTSPSAGTRLC